MKKIYTSVDIGSDSIKVVVLELFKNKLNLLAASSVKSSGIKKGLITNATAAATSLKNALSEVEEILGIPIRKVIASVPIHNAVYSYSKATIDIKNEDKLIGQEEINLVLKKSVKEKIELGQELVTVIPIDFTVDDRGEVKDPKGMTGEKLSCRSIIVFTPKKNIYSVLSLIESVGVEVVDVSVNVIGDGFAFRNKDNVSEIGAVVNIGAETTTISIYNKGVLVKASIIPLGGRNIDSDIAYIFKLSLQSANKLKEKFATAHRRFSNVNEVKEIDNVSNETIKINQYELSEVVMFRIEEILQLVKKEINSLTNKKMQYIILTGGSSNMANLKCLAEEVLEQSVSIGDIKVIGARNNKYSSTVGNIVYFINKLNLKGVNYSMLSVLEQDEISDAKRSERLGSSNLGRIFNYFTNE